MTKPQMLEALRPILSNRLRRAMDAGPVVYVGVFKEESYGIVGFRFRQPLTGRYEYLRVTELWPHRLVGRSSPLPFDFRAWCEEGGGEAIEACRRLKKWSQKHANQHGIPQRYQGARYIPVDAVGAVQPQ